MKTGCKTGVIGHYNQRKKSGWIAPDDGSKNIYFASDIFSGKLKLNPQLDLSGRRMEYSLDKKSKIEYLDIRPSIADLLSENKTDEFIEEISAKGLIPTKDLVNALIIANEKKLFQLVDLLWEKKPIPQLDLVDALKIVVERQANYVAALLLKNKADCNKPYKRQSFTGGLYYNEYAFLLPIACFHGNFELVQTLIEFNANCLIKETQHCILRGITPLGATVLGACQADANILQNYLSIIELLLEKGADINAPEIDGKTVFQVAVHNHALTLAKFLANKGAAVDAPVRKQGKVIEEVFTVFHLAFIDKDHFYPPIRHEKRFKENWDIVKFLVEQGVANDQQVKIEIDYCSPKICTPLFIAIRNGAPLKVIDDLIELGAKFYSVPELNPLKRAIYYERYDIAGLLLHYGAGIGENFSKPSYDRTDKWDEKLKKSFEIALSKKQIILLNDATKDDQTFIDYLRANELDVSLVVATTRDLVEKQAELFKFYDKKSINNLIRVCYERLKERPDNKNFFYLKNILSLYRPQSLIHNCLNFLNSNKAYHEEALICEELPDELKEQLRLL